MDNVVQLFPSKKEEKTFTIKKESKNIFSLEEANEMLSLITTITRKTKQNINVINSQAAYFKGQAIKTTELQNKINDILSRWSDKMRKLGVTPVAMFKVRFDTDQGSYFWQFPDMKLYQEV